MASESISLRPSIRAHFERLGIVSARPDHPIYRSGPQVAIVLPQAPKQEPTSEEQPPA